MRHYAGILKGGCFILRLQQQPLTNEIVSLIRNVYNNWFMTGDTKK